VHAVLSLHVWFITDADTGNQTSFAWLLSVNHALISLLTTHPFLWLMLPLLSTHHSHSITPTLFHSRLPWPSSSGLTPRTLWTVYWYTRFSRTTQVSWYQKGKTSVEKVSGSGISCSVCKSAPRCRQISTPAPVFAGQMPFLPPSQQHQSTEGFDAVGC